MLPDHWSTEDGHRVLKKTDDAIPLRRTSSDGGSIFYSKHCQTMCLMVDSSQWMVRLSHRTFRTSLELGRLDQGVLYPLSFFGARRMLWWLLEKHLEFKQFHIKRIVRIDQWLHIRTLAPKIKTTRRSQSLEHHIFL